MTDTEDTDAVAPENNGTSGDDDTIEGRAHGIWRDLWLATAFLTRLPMPALAVPPAWRGGEDAPPLPALGTAARAFPLAGVLVGLCGALGVWVGFALGLHPLGIALLCLALATVATGALHEDGLADVADGFGGGNDRDRKLEILRDSRIGSYGVIALVLGVGLRAAALMSFLTPTQAAFAFIAAAAISRAGLPVMMWMMAPAREDGLGFDAGRPERDDVIAGLLIGALIGFLFVGFGATVAVAFFAAIAMGAVGWLAHRQIGGMTGDVLGAAQQAGEVAVLFAAVWMLA